MKTLSLLKETAYKTVTTIPSLLTLNAQEKLHCQGALPFAPFPRHWKAQCNRQTTSLQLTTWEPSHRQLNQALSPPNQPQLGHEEVAQSQNRTYQEDSTCWFAWEAHQSLAAGDSLESVSASSLTSVSAASKAWFLRLPNTKRED